MVSSRAYDLRQSNTNFHSSNNIVGMGKSNKKVKADRINALRKQYDAFLEEDKKRKNRNEYILGWLDRVRSCPTFTSSRQKEKQFGHSQDITIKAPEFIPQYRAPCTSNAISTYSKNLDETIILKEISKSYILIPKKYTVPDNQNRYPTPASSNGDNDTDWKRKYDILNELKQNEEECIQKKPSKTIISTEPLNVCDNYNIPEKDESTEKVLKSNETPRCTEKVQDSSLFTGEIQILGTPEKDAFENKEYNDTQNGYHPLNEKKTNLRDNDNSDLSKDNINDFSNEPEKLMSNLFISPPENINLKSELQNVDKKQYGNNEINKDHVTSNQNSSFILENQYAEKEQNIEEYNQPREIGYDHDSCQKSALIPDSQDAVKEQYLENYNQPNEISQDKVLLKPEIKHTDNEQYNEFNNQYQPTTISENQQHEINTSTLSNSDFINKVKLHNAELTIEKSVDDTKSQELKQGENRDPTSTENLNNFENPSHFEDSALIGSNENETLGLVQNNVDFETSQIEEYEDEQKNLFYSDNTNENYAYNQADGQNAAGNETYENNEHYSYYEATKDEANYGTEINEHVESTERYDPNYEQQYVTNYDGNPAQYQNEHYEEGYFNEQQEQNQDYQQQQYENYDQQNYEYQQPSNTNEERQYDNVNAYENPVGDQNNQDVIYDQGNVSAIQGAQNESHIEEKLDFEEGYAIDQNTAEIEKKISPVEVNQDVEQNSNLKTT